MSARFMNLRDLILEISMKYIRAKSEGFRGHPIANFIRNQPSWVINPLLLNDSLLVRGSAGQGGWADIPWIAIYDRNETDGPQEGIYIVYLFSDDCSRVYLTLDFGILRPIQRDGRALAFKKMEAQISSIQVNYPLGIEGFKADDRINLSVGGRGADYEKSIVYYREYQIDSLEDNAVLEKDLSQLAAFYQNYLLESDVLTADTDFDTVGNVEEGKRKLKTHYVRERNKKIIRLAKKKALQENGFLICAICKFSFLDHYGTRGENYIEGHHTKPVSGMNDGDVTRVEDIILICSNCHRMIHAKEPWLSPEELRGIYQ